MQLLHESGYGVVACAFHFLFLYLLLDEILGVAYRRRCSGDRDYAVAGAGREGALLRDLNVGAGHLLDLY